MAKATNNCVHRVEILVVFTVFWKEKKRKKIIREKNWKPDQLREGGREGWGEGEVSGGKCVGGGVREKASKQKKQNKTKPV